MTVYLSIFSCILLIFGGTGAFFAQDLIFQAAWGFLLLSGIVILVITLYIRPGTNTRTTPQKPH